MIISVAWRNVWRSKLRSLVVILAVCLGLIGGIFSAAVMKGAIEQRTRAAISTETGHIQIHNPDFNDNPEMSNFIPKVNEITQYLNSSNDISAYTLRSKTMGMASTAESSTGAMIVGIDPDKEKEISVIYEKVNQGSYFESKKKNPILLGNKMAETLDAQVGNKVIIRMQKTEGDFIDAAFSVVGIYDIPNDMYEKTNVFIMQSDIERLSEQENIYHEIAMNVHDMETMELVQADFKKRFGDEIEVMNWKEIMPEVGMMSEYMDLFMFIILIFILLALAFGILNTMLMAILERVKELGMLMAVGMTRLRVFNMIMLETVFLSLTGAIAGMIISALLVNWTGNRGLDFAQYGEGFGALGYDSMVYPSLDYSFFIMLTLMVIFTALLSSIYPAWKALQLNPSDALRTE